jgi:hypothetical protein
VVVLMQEEVSGLEAVLEQTREELAEYKAKPSAAHLEQENLEIQARMA